MTSAIATAVGPEEGRTGRAGRAEPAVRVSLTIFKELVGETESGFFLKNRSDDMTEPDILSRDIDALMAEQRTAWRELASPALTTFDRREIRNRIRQGETVLRDYLKVRTERFRFRPQPVEASVDSLANINFRLLS
jgi:hypothetical protein